MSGASSQELHMNNMPRLLIVWPWVPCNETGAGILMRRLFESYPPDRLWLLTSSPAAQSTRTADPVPPPERHVTVSHFSFPRRFIHRFATFLNYLLIPVLVWRGVKMVRRHSIASLFAVPWNEYCAAAYFIHRLTGCPLFVYFMDDPLGSPGTRAGFLYRALMPRFLRAARRVWGITPAMCAHLEKTYGVKCELLPPFADTGLFTSAGALRSASPETEARIVYTGAIYTAQLDALQNLARALAKEQLDSNGTRFSLTLYTSLPESTLRQMGLTGSKITRSFVPNTQMPDVLAGARILFLPFSFAQNMRHVVETSIPAKLAEYLASGTPILVHAPSYSSASRYCREKNLALVVDQPDPALLAQAILRLATDAKLREELSANARAAAQQVHSRESVLPRFFAGLAS
jgi:glycosyltransferase involved in cell wall biosynthesis